MNDTPKGSRTHIAIFGRRNAGKSSLINALTNQDLALVSAIPGTTTDPVYKAMEILPLGPVMMIDTAGIDDVGALGEKRVEKTLAVLNKTDIALLVLEPQDGIKAYEEKIIGLCKNKDIPLVVVFNKEDLIDDKSKEAIEKEYRQNFDFPYFWTDSLKKKGIRLLREELGKIKAKDQLPSFIVGDLLKAQDIVVLVTPIDDAAPKGRLILPQVQTIRDILDHNCVSVVCQVSELPGLLAKLNDAIKLVITDSQAFREVASLVPKRLPLTSFSILMARYKGELDALIAGAKAMNHLKVGDRLLIAEACTHHEQADDIGKVKIPRLLRQQVQGDLVIDFSSGYTFPNNLHDYDLVIHCGACMLNRKNMLNRIKQAQQAGVPIINYGVLLANANGILPRALEPFALKIDP